MKAMSLTSPITYVKISTEEFRSLRPSLYEYVKLSTYVHVVRVVNLDRFFFTDDLILRNLSGHKVPQVLANSILSDKVIDDLYEKGSIRPIHKEIYIRHRSRCIRPELDSIYCLGPTKFANILKGPKYPSTEAYIKVCFYAGLIDYMSPISVDPIIFKELCSAIGHKFIVTEHNWKYLCSDVKSIVHAKDAIKLVGWDSYAKEMKNVYDIDIIAQLHMMGLCSDKQVIDLCYDRPEDITKVGIIYVRDKDPVLNNVKDMFSEDAINTDYIKANRLHPKYYHNDTSILNNQELLTDIISCDYTINELVHIFGTSGIYFSQH